MPNQFIDMHMHSTASDGTSTPEEIARLCKDAGLEYCALTDHDTIAGVERFLAEARKLGLRALPAVEFNTQYDGELHILGYGIDINNPEIAERLRYLAHSRSTRAERMVKKLNENGIDISMERVKELAGSGVMGRPHIARALVEKGYAKDLPRGFKEFISAGCIGYVERESISRKEAISLIKKAGGVAVFAHPGITAAADTAGLVKTMVEEGIDGIEVYYPTHTDEQTEEYLALAKKYGLYVTCGSDFHGSTRPGVSVNEEKRGDTYLKKSVMDIFNKFPSIC